MGDVTQLLRQIERGDRCASEKLLPLIYAELRGLASARMAAERQDHTLQATALVHEAYLRLVNREVAEQWQSVGQFYAAAAEAMRRILIDHARNRAREKRGGGRKRVDLDRIDLAERTNADELIVVDESLSRLALEHPQSAELVKLRFYCGMKLGEAAHVLGISQRTAKRYLAFARGWMADDLQRGDLA
ncbi:MAG: sigma-70 family RNA polymerase sigma factor [Planctomycetales bacterium]|nr:sigma-70 family RNA polymerase sigma factor [Planctomycetales bacterium]